MLQGELKKLQYEIFISDKRGIEMDEKQGITSGLTLVALEHVCAFIIKRSQCFSH